MRHSNNQLFLSSILLMLCLNTSYALPLPPRATVWGFAGSDVVGRGDIMTGLFGTDRALVWADAQAKYGQEGTWMGSLGTGYRQVYQNARVLGAYGFIDYNVSPNGNSFWVASPGIESMGRTWDLRLNGYFPVSDRTKTAGPIIAGDAIGVQSIFFTGHEQYNRLYNLVEKVGNGVDGEIGRTFADLHQTRAYVGGYYFNASDNNLVNSVSSIQGISGRLEYPLRKNVVLQFIDTYDNYAHNTALVGLQVSFDNYSNRAMPVEPKTRILDPIPRNLGSQYTGSGIPIVKGYQSNGAVLQNSNIYFFTSTGGSPYSMGSPNGTYENPLNDTSFTQTNVDAINLITPDAEFYFNPGTYQFDPSSPNGRISLYEGQSMWGREPGYILPAQGNDRPLFLGGIDLGVNLSIPAGNNRLDSISVLNALTIISQPQKPPANMNNDTRGIDIEGGASNIVFFNDKIQASSTVLGDLPFGYLNAAEAIYANSPTITQTQAITIENTCVIGTATVEGDGYYENFAGGLGGNTPGPSGNGDVMNNNFTINNSCIAAYATTTGNNVIENFAFGIGGNGASDGTANFDKNILSIKDTTITAGAFTGGDNAFANFAVGIGGNNNAGSGEFDGNTLMLEGDTIQANAIVKGNNIYNTDQEPYEPPFGSGQNSAAGIGSNSIYEGDANFQGNQVSILNSSISANASVASNMTSDAANFAAGIGGNAADNVYNASADLYGNTFTIENTTLNVTATIREENDGLNFAAGTGGNSVGVDVTTFQENTFTFNNSPINSTALVMGNNDRLNFAGGIGSNNIVNENPSFTYNMFTFNSNSQINSTALIMGNNNKGLNSSNGIGGNIVTENSLFFTNNTFHISNTQLNSIASVNGMNQYNNQSTGVNTNSGDMNTIGINFSTIDVLAQAAPSNTAGGLLANSTDNTGTITIKNSILSVLALPTSTGTVTCNTGNVTFINTPHC